MTVFLALVEQVTAELTAGLDPDADLTRRALVLAVHAASAANHTTEVSAVADWDLYLVAVIDAVETVQADLDQVVPARAPVPDAGPDSEALRRAVTVMVRRLADLYTAAAASDRGTAWRRLGWAQAAHRLDDAASELT